MVILSRIYTKTGDDGTTALGNGKRVAKDDLRVEAFGDVDEVNATIGVLSTMVEDPATRERLRGIANDLFDVGADLCLPLEADEAPGAHLRVTEAHVEKLERAIDEWNATLAPLTSFVLPGGTPAAAWCHLARTVCRRAERRVVTLGRNQPVNAEVAKYLNRLSDLLFVLARRCNGEGAADLLWQPGQGAGIAPPSSSRQA